MSSVLCSTIIDLESKFGKECWNEFKPDLETGTRGCQ